VYQSGGIGPVGQMLYDELTGRGSHSFPLQLNVSTFCWTRWVHDFAPVYETGGHADV